MMENKNSSLGGNFTARLDDDYSDEIDHLPFENLKKKKTFPRLRFGGFQKNGRVLGFLGCFLVILIVLLIVFLPGKSKKRGSLTLVRLETRLQALEEKLNRLEFIEQQLASFTEDTREFEMFMKKYERLDAAKALKIDFLAKQLKELREDQDALKSQMVEMAKPQPVETVSVKVEKPPASPAKSVELPAAKKKAVKKATERYHTVVKGNTVYSISRRYGITVEDLQRANKLSPQLLIHPGQKLRIPVAKTN